MAYHSSDPESLSSAGEEIYQCARLCEKYGYMDCVGIPKEQGVMAFWRGNTPLIWMYVYQTVLQIGIFDSIK